MNNNENISHNETLKRVILLLVSLALLNPVILFLISGSIILSFLIPFLFTTVFFFLRENKKLNPLRVIFFNLILVVSFFIHAEAIFTFRFSEYIIEDLYSVRNKYYFNRPFLNQTFRDKEFIVQYKTNAQGFRIGAEDEPETIVVKADWLFIGDSYTQGAQVQFEELYTSKLFNYFPNKVVVNAGISGMGIADEYNYYINEGKNLKPKKVFLQICNFNDFINVGERTAGFSDYLMHYSNFARFVLYGFKYANPAELPLGRWTEPFYPDEKSNEAYNVFYKKQSEQKKKDLNSFGVFLKKFNDAVIKNGGELVVIQIPTKEQVYYKYFDEVVSGFKIDVSKLDMHYPNGLLDSLCRKSNIKHLDLLSDFTNTDSDLYFQYDEHLNINGHQQIASSIFNFLNQQKQEEHEQILISSLNVGDRYPNFALNDCNSLVYQSFRDGNMEIFMSDSLMINAKRITWNKVDESHPSISPDGKRLVFTEGNQAENETQVVVMNIDGSERRYITSEKNTFGAIPSFNNDGSKVTYAEWRKDTKNGLMSNPYIVVYDFEKKIKITVTNDSVEHWRPIFSLDGNSLIYISKEENNQFDVFEHSLSTNQKRNLTKTNYEEWDIALSPNGKLLAYAGNKHGNWDLFLLELETGKLQQLTNSIGNEWDASFSPCNSYLYYSATYGLRNGIFRIKLK
jgi:hypothetical protein